MLDADLMQEKIAERRARARHIFRGQGRERLQQMAEVAASSAPPAIDYLEQAPVSLLLAWARAGRTSHGNLSLAFKSRQRVSLNYADASARGLKLRMLIDRCWPQVYKEGSLRTITLPQPAPPGLYVLRKIKGNAMRPSYIAALLRLACWIEPVALGHMIPRTAGRQEMWLRSLSAFEAQLCRRVTYGGFANSRGYGTDALKMVDDAQMHGFSNFARVASALSADPPDGSHCADFIISTGQFDVAFEPQQFLRAVDNWVRPFGAEERLPHPDFEVSYEPLFDQPTQVPPFEFVPLRTGAALAEEGRVMKHCVASYADHVRSGESFIYSVRQDGERVATLELQTQGPGSGVLAVQLKGPRNAMASASVGEGVRAFTHLCHRRLNSVLGRALREE